MDIVAENAQLKQRVAELEAQLFDYEAEYGPAPMDIPDNSPGTARATVIAAARTLVFASAQMRTAAMDELVHALRVFSQVDRAAWRMALAAHRENTVKGSCRPNRREYFLITPGNLVLSRDNYTCQYCGTQSASDYCGDHIIPRSKKGPTAAYNLTTACLSCNNRKGVKVWVPANLDLITEGHPEHRARVLELAVPHAQP